MAFSPIAGHTAIIPSAYPRDVFNLMRNLDTNSKYNGRITTAIVNLF